MVKLPHEAGVAVMRYAEEVKMYANLRDSRIRNGDGGAKDMKHLPKVADDLENSRLFLLVMTFAYW